MGIGLIAGVVERIERSVLTLGVLRGESVRREECV